MTKEDKELLFKDLCARLPYGVIVEKQLIDAPMPKHTPTETLKSCLLSDFFQSIENLIVKPYLRPMKSMTKDERKEWSGKVLMSPDTVFSDKMDVLYDFCNSHHLDYRRLIEKGLAIEAPDGMYKIE